MASFRDAGRRPPVSLGMVEQAAVEQARSGCNGRVGTVEQGNGRAAMVGQSSTVAARPWELHGGTDYTHTCKKRFA